MGWRFYARRPSGAWIHTNVPLEAEMTDSASKPGVITGTIPAALDEPVAEDGRPMWLERGTRLYCEVDKQLTHVGVCTFSQVTGAGRQLEFTTLSGALNWMTYDDVYTAWRPPAANVVTEMVNKAQAHPKGDLGFVVRVVGTAPGSIGDPKPPARPVRPGKRPTEARAAFNIRLAAWQTAADVWDDTYRDREPYQLVWYEPKFIGDELEQLASEVPFLYRERHAWTDRDTLTATHTLDLTGDTGLRRTDIEFVDGVNIAERITPATSDVEYANDVIVLGSGEGSKMKRARSTVNDDDGRFWSAKVLTQKDVSNVSRLKAIADRERRLSVMETGLDSVVAWDQGSYASVNTLRPGDEVWVESAAQSFGAFLLIESVTRSTKSSRVTIRFVQGDTA